jgi:hypothetical protein
VCRPHGRAALAFAPLLLATNVARAAARAAAAIANGPNISSSDGMVWDATGMFTVADPLAEHVLLKPNQALSCQPRILRPPGDTRP